MNSLSNYKNATIRAQAFNSSRYVCIRDNTRFTRQRKKCLQYSYKKYDYRYNHHSKRNHTQSRSGLTTHHDGQSDKSNICTAGEKRNKNAVWNSDQYCYSLSLKNVLFPAKGACCISRTLQERVPFLQRWKHHSLQGLRTFSRTSWRTFARPAHPLLSRQLTLVPPLRSTVLSLQGTRDRSLYWKQTAAAESH